MPTESKRITWREPNARTLTTASALCAALRAAGCVVERASCFAQIPDAHILATPEARAILQHYEYRDSAIAFRSNIDGAVWYEVPFAYVAPEER